MPAVIDTHETVSQLLTSIDAGRQHANLSSAMRLFVLGHYQPRSTLEAKQGWTFGPVHLQWEE
jgi:predicted DNA-binding ribbon-helix-helix protein